MSKKKTKKPDLSRKVMQTIKTQRLKMRPKIYFALGSVLLSVGLAGAVVFSAFFINLIFFKLKTHRPLGLLFLAHQVGFKPFFLTFPWLSLSLSLVGVWLGSRMIKKYDISYKKNFWLLILILMLTVCVLGLFISKTKINPRLKKVRPLHHFYHSPYSPPPHLFERKHLPFLYQ